MTEKVSIFYADDWAWVFLGDELVIDAHRVDELHLLHLLGIEVGCAWTENIGSIEAEEKMLVNLSCAGKLSDVSSEYLEALEALE